MRPFQVLVLTFFVVSCDGDRQVVPRLESPAGHGFYFQDRGSFAFDVDVGAQFDQAVADAKVHLWPYGIEAHEVDAVVAHLGQTVIDHFLIATPASPTGYASGIYWVSLEAIQTALYSRQRNADGPPHTHHTWASTGETHSGILPAPCPALGHELGHYWFGAEFEHGWTPPVVRGRVVLAARDWSAECVVLP